MGRLLTNQQMEDINNETSRLKNYLKLLELCAAADKDGKKLSTKVIEV